MATFSELQTRVQTRIIDLPSAVQAEVPSLVNKALIALQKRHNFEVMKALQSYTTTVSTRSIGSVPSDWKEERGVPYEVPENSRVRPLAWGPNRTEAEKGWGTNTDLDFGEPRVILRSEPSAVTGASTFEVFPYPDGNSDYGDGEYRIRVPYWKFLPALSGASDTNWFTVYAEEYIEAYATSLGFAIDWDEEREAVWLQKADMHRKELIRLDKLSQVAQLDGFHTHLDYYEVRVNR